MSIYTKVGDTIQGKKMVFEGSHLKRFDLYMKSSSHRGQRAYLYNGKCWIESALDIKEVQEPKEQSEKKTLKKSQKNKPKKQVRKKHW